MWYRSFKRIIPVGFALFPVGILFGVMASQVKWSAWDVFWMSVLGFTGSGQFTMLGFYNQGIEVVGYATAFIVILSINLRYIPMSISATSHWRAHALFKGLAGHCLADESYAVEVIDDEWFDRMVIRLVIFVSWVASTVTGVVAAAWIPASIKDWLIDFTFPVSLILILLSFANIKTYYLGARKIMPVGIAFIGAVCFYQVLGSHYFWLPSIIFSFVVLVRG